MSSDDYFIAENGHRLRHGTQNAYSAGKCRCDDCTEAHAIVQRDYRERKKGASVAGAVYRSFKRAQITNLDPDVWRVPISVPREVIEGAACKGHPTDWWLAHHGDNPNSPEAAQAKLICEKCPVRDACLAHATFDAWEPTGIWGGKSMKQRRQLRREFVASRLNHPAAPPEPKPEPKPAPSERVIGIPHSRNTFMGDRIA